MTDLNEAEEQVVEAYRTLERVLRERGDELPPFARRNTAKAVASLWQVANGLDQEPGQVYDIGV